MFTLLRQQHPAVTQILTHSVNPAFEPKPGLETNVKFGLVISGSDRVQVWKWTPFKTRGCDKGLQFCFMADFNVDCVFSYFVTINFTLRHWCKRQKTRGWSSGSQKFFANQWKILWSVYIWISFFSTKFFLRYLSDVQVVLSFATPPIFHCFACLQA